MEKAKKLKDLKKGDRVCYYHFSDTTPITVIKAKRTGDVMEVTVKWDDSEYVTYGHALGYVLTGFSRKWRSTVLLTSDFDDVRDREAKKEKDKTYNSIGRSVVNLLGVIKSSKIF